MAKEDEPDKKTEQVQNLRRSGAAGPHGDRRERRNRDRSARRRNAIQDQD